MIADLGWGTQGAAELLHAAGTLARAADAGVRRTGGNRERQSTITKTMRHSR
jgi:hypothetical protein